MQWTLPDPRRGAGQKHAYVSAGDIAQQGAKVFLGLCFSFLTCLAPHTRKHRIPRRRSCESAAEFMGIFYLPLKV